MAGYVDNPDGSISQLVQIQNRTTSFQEVFKSTTFAIDETQAGEWHHIDYFSTIALVTNGDKFKKIIAQVQWGFDGQNMIAYDEYIANEGMLKEIIETKAPYVRIQLHNANDASQKISAWVYCKA